MLTFERTETDLVVKMDTNFHPQRENVSETRHFVLDNGHNFCLENKMISLVSSYHHHH